MFQTAQRGCCFEISKAWFTGSQRRHGEGSVTMCRGRSVTAHLYNATYCIQANQGVALGLITPVLFNQIKGIFGSLSSVGRSHVHALTANGAAQFID